MGPLVGALLLVLGSPAAPATSDELAQDLEALASRLDDADPELPARIAARGNEAALEGLLAVYPRLASAFMRREVLRALPLFADGPASGAAMAHLEEVATGSPSPYLRGQALDALAASGARGAAVLRGLVDSRADDAVRGAAMDRLAADPRESDHAWFLTQYLPPEMARDRRGGHGGDGEGPPLLPRVRRLAFDVVRGSLGELELAAACLDPDREIRMRALLELESIGSERLVPIARDMLEAPREYHAVRATAARVLWRARGMEEAEELLELGGDHVTPLLLRYALAELLAQAPLDGRTERKLVNMLRRGREFHKLFALHVLRDAGSERAADAIVDALDDESPTVVFYAMEIVAARGEASAEEALREILAEGGDPSLAATAVSALDAIAPDVEGWRAELLELARDPRVPVRSVALTELAEEGDAALVPSLAAALEDPSWSVRLSALRGLERLRVPAVVAPIVARMDDEEGRLRTEFAETLWRLTGEPFGENAAAWRAWSSELAEPPALVSVDELDRIERERFERELRERTFTPRAEGERAALVAADGPAFFGVGIDSHRVQFVVDVSLSMEVALREEYAGSRNLRRFDAARAELAMCLERLEPGTLFGVFAFSARLDRWNEDGLRRATPETLASAREYVEELNMGSGTDLWQALDAALDVDASDTVYLLSDGEPEGGPIVDPVQIRMEFRRRNAGRRVRVHAIAFGDDIALLRWLAEDSGGSYTRLR